MRPIRNRLARAAAIAALLLAAFIGQATPASADEGGHHWIFISPDDGGGVLYLLASPDDGGGVLIP